MDPICHTLVGATLAETGLKRLSRFGGATLVVGANLPDLDAVSYAIDSDLSLFVRRGWTHGVAALVVLPVVLALAVSTMGRWKTASATDRPPARFGPLLLLSFISVWSHPALDWLNTYGVRLMMPFDGQWFYGDALFIVDPWMWLAGSAAVAMAWWTRRGGPRRVVAALVLLSALVLLNPLATIPARIAWLAGISAVMMMARSARWRARLPAVAVVALSLMTAYGALMRVVSLQARATAERWLASRGVSPESLMAGPAVARPFTRDVVVVHRDRYEFLLVGWPGGRVEPYGPVLPRGAARDAAVIEAALAAPEVRGFRTWMRFPSFEVQRLTDGYRVVMEDVRYSRGGTGGFASAVVELDPSLRHRPVSRAVTQGE